MEAARTKAGFWDRISSSLNARRPIWKVAMISTFALLILIATLLSVPQTSNILKSGFFPEGRRVISGPQLTAEEQKKAKDILMADPRVRDILSTGAAIDKILPIQVTMQRINSETGVTEEVHETWAQAWIVKGSKDWGVQIDLVRSTVVSISP